MIYVYLCKECKKETEQSRAMDDRDNPDPCECGCKDMEILIQKTSFKMQGPVGKVYGSDAEIESEIGKDWRETSESRRMASGEPGKIYSLPGKK